MMVGGVSPEDSCESRDCQKGGFSRRERDAKSHVAGLLPYLTL
jgi:hypothetical protein